MEDNMSFRELNLDDFSEILASSEPVPGGGGASALAGAVGAALGSMVCNLTTGKKRYAQYEEDIQRIIKEASVLRAELLGLIDGDAEAFAPLAKAYSIPKDAPERQEVMEAALREACRPPLDIMKACSRVIELHSELSGKGSAIAISDVGGGAVIAKAALKGASLNVFINTKAMTDREYAERISEEADAMLEKYCPMADETFEKVLGMIK